MSNSSRPHGLYNSWKSVGQNTGVGSLSLLQGILPIQGLNLGRLHCRQILYQLSHKGSPNYPHWLLFIHCTFCVTHPEIVLSQEVLGQLTFGLS